MGAQRALGRARRAPADLDVTLSGLVDRLTGRLRTAHRLCRTVTLRLRFDDYTRLTRSRTLAQPTTETELVLGLARGLLAAARPLIDARGITLIGVTLANLTDDRAVQDPLPFGTAGALDDALDSLRDRYGTTAVTRATLLGHDPGPSVPLLPD